MSKLKFIIPAVIIVVAGILYFGSMHYATREAESQLRHMADALNAREVEWESVRPSLFGNDLTVKKLKLIDMDSMLGKATLSVDEFHADNAEETILTLNGLDMLFSDPNQEWGQAKADRLTVTGGNLLMNAFSLYRQIGDETPVTQIGEIRLTSRDDNQGMRFSIHAEHILDADTDPMILDVLGRQPGDHWTGSNLVINGHYDQPDQQFAIDLNVVTPEVAEVTSSLTLNRISDLRGLLAEMATLSGTDSLFNPAGLAHLLSIEPHHFSLSIHDFDGKAITLLEKTGDSAMTQGSDPALLCAQDPEQVRMMKGLENCITVMRWTTGHSKGFTLDARAVKPFSLLDAALLLATDGPDLLLENIAITVQEQP